MRLGEPLHVLLFPQLSSSLLLESCRRKTLIASVFFCALAQ
jgi:hypothetical protein